MARFIGSLSLAAAAYWLAVGVGIPGWRDWVPGDASDIAICVYVGCTLLTRPRTTTDKGSTR